MNLFMKRQETTRSLTERAKNGDRAAFDELVRRSGGHLRSAIEKDMGEALRQKVEVDDIVQETLVQALQSISKFEATHEGSFQQWLLGIARHVVLRAATRTRSAEALELDSELDGKDETPSRALRREERFARLDEALKSLSPEHQQVIRLSRIEGLKVKEIATRMSRSPDAVMKLLSRALEKLKTSFGHTDSLSLPSRSLGEKGGPHGKK